MTRGSRGPGTPEVAGIRRKRTVVFVGTLWNTQKMS